MKKGTFILLIAILFIGCSRDPDIGQTDELGKGDGNLSVDGGMLGLDGVFVWDKESEISFTDYYSQIDTFISERTINRGVKYYCSEDETVFVKWTTNGRLSDSKETKTWKGDEQKWLVINAATIDINGISENLQIEVIVQFASTAARRFKTIPKITDIKSVSDAFGYTFGTPRTEISVSRDISPQFSYTPDHQEIHLLEFSNGKLIRLYSLKSLSFFMGFDWAVNQCKIQESIKFDYSEHILNPQEWAVGNLKMKVYNTTMREILNPEDASGYNDYYDREIACLTIEKLQ
jgi:hypothetical protein